MEGAACWHVAGGGKGPRERLADFSPSKRTVEPDDVEQVVGEFRRFLVDALESGADELCMVELE